MEIEVDAQQLLEWIWEHYDTTGMTEDDTIIRVQLRFGGKVVFVIGQD